MVPNSHFAARDGLAKAVSMTGALLSVILPNYNHARYLERAINAIANQGCPPDEIIVIDDASSDESREVLIGCQRLHSNLKVLFNQQNLGALSCLQRGLELSTGRYVYFAAADDQVLPRFFRNAVDALEAMPTIGLFCAETILVDGETGARLGRRPVVRPLRTAGPLRPKEVEDLLRHADNFIHTGSTIFRREALLNGGGFMIDAGSFSDGLLARKIALTDGMWFMPMPVATWHIHLAGLSRQTALVLDKAMNARIMLPQLIARDRAFPPWYGDLFERRWRFGSARLALNVTPPDQAILAAMAPRSLLDRAVMAAVRPFLRFRAARLILLVWLTLRLRPYRLRDVAGTAINRWTEGNRGCGASSPDKPKTRREFE